MSSPITSSQFIKLLDSNLREVHQNTWDELESQIPTFYKVVGSDKARERYYGVGAVPDIPAFNGQLEYLPVAPGFETVIEPKVYAGGLAFERTLIDDNQYDVLTNQVAMLTEAIQRTQEKHGIEAFANAFTSAFTFMTSEENLSLCNSSHTNKSGASTATGFDNAGTSAISKTSIAATYLAMRQFRGDVGQRYDVNPSAIVVPESQYFATVEALGYDAQTGASSDKDPDSGDNMINSQYKRFKVIPCRRLDDYSSTNWFMVDERKMKQMLIWINRDKPETKMTVDFDTWLTKWSVWARYGYGFTDWRWIYGHVVA